MRNLQHSRVQYLNGYFKELLQVMGELMEIKVALDKTEEKMIQLPIYKKEFFRDKLTFDVDLTEGLYQFVERPEHISVDYFSEYNPLYFETVNRNAIDIFNYLFSNYKKLIFVTAIMSFDNIPKERTNFMSKYIRNHHK